MLVTNNEGTGDHFNEVSGRRRRGIEKLFSVTMANLSTIMGVH